MSTFASELQVEAQNTETAFLYEEAQAGIPSATGTQAPWRPHATLAHWHTQHTRQSWQAPWGGHDGPQCLPVRKGQERRGASTVTTEQQWQYRLTDTVLRTVTPVSRHGVTGMAALLAAVHAK